MSKGKTICTVCNYIYDEAMEEPSSENPSIKFENLPDEWCCPVCGSSKDMFQPCSCVSLHIYEQTCVSNHPLAVKTIGQLVAEKADRACLFEQYGLDYCCGGGKTLQQACIKKGVNIDEIIEKLTALDAKANQSAQEPDWRKSSLKELVEHIITCYHQPLRAGFPRLSQLVEKVARVHGENHPEMVEIEQIFKTFREQLELHMQKEELILFPGICGIEAGGSPRAFGCGGGIDHPIEVMTHEHDDAGEALSKMRRLSNDFTAPAAACNTFKVLLHELAKLELEMHEHVHKENNILFPRTLELAKASEIALK